MTRLSPPETLDDRIRRIVREELGAIAGHAVPDMEALRADIADMHDEVAASASRSARTAQVLARVTRDGRPERPSEPRLEGCV